MTRMFRKQIYISRRQQVQLKRLAKAHDVSEAEVIRQALEREGLLSAAQPAAGGASALEEFLRFGASRRAIEDTTGRTWTRNELYDERLTITSVETHRSAELPFAPTGGLEK